MGGAAHVVFLGGEDVFVDGEALELAMEYAPGDQLIETEVGGEAIAVKLDVTRTGFRMTTRGAAHVLDVLPANIGHLADHMIEKIPPDLSGFLICPMPGLLVSLDVEEGDSVESGQPLAVVEAMKMENILRAEKAGVVAKINAKAGDSLAVDAVILEME